MTGKRSAGIRPWSARALAAILVFSAAPAMGQDNRLPPGVDLESRYSKAGRPLIAIRPFSGPMGASGITQISDIIQNDLTLSDRFEIFPVTAELAQPGPVQFDVWNSLNVVFLITGDVTPTANGFQLLLTAHDVVYGREKQSGTFQIPASSHPNFRMAVHVASDEIVRWLTGQPGMAATRVTFVRMNPQSYDLMIVDSDGENLRRLAGNEGGLYGPAWSPDGSKIAHSEHVGSAWRLVERDVATGRTRVLATGTLVTGPTYSPDGTKIYFGLDVPGRGAQGGTEIHEHDLASGRNKRLTDSPFDNMLPTISPDGRRMAFLSVRTGRQHIYVANSDGTNARQLTPSGERVQYNGPDWSPTSNQVAFHGQSRGSFQIMVADATRPGGQVLQLTSRGENEDPSWAPDGRHIVYTGTGADGNGLYVIDTRTGNIRILVRGARLRYADWSLSLAGAVSAVQ